MVKTEIRFNFMPGLKLKLKMQARRSRLREDRIFTSNTKVHVCMCVQCVFACVWCW